jgi:hypothetical protein
MPRDERNRKAPAWVPYFLKSLERLGQVRAAAEEAGVDFTSAYARRKAHSDFAEAWDAALQRRRRRVMCWWRRRRQRSGPW